MNRTDLQKLAEMRIEEARILLGARQYPGAYYLAGYAVECALKACIAKKTKRHDFPDKETVLRGYTHNVANLMVLADLQGSFDSACAADPDLVRNWTIIKDWNEKARYERKRSRAEAEDLYNAITDSQHGVLPWVRSHW